MRCVSLSPGSRIAPWLGSLVLSSVVGCTSLAPGYSLESYKNATSLKAEVQSLAAESSDAFSAHAADVKALNVKMQAAFEYAAGLPNNAIVAQEWRIMLAPTGHLYGGFVSRWQAAGKLSTTEAADERDLLGRAFDQIICAEADKQASVTCSAASTAATGARK
jgi:hypothetical protein